MKLDGKRISSHRKSNGVLKKGAHTMVSENISLCDAAEKAGFVDTWTFQGRSLTAPVGKMPEPFASAFRETKVENVHQRADPYSVDYDDQQLSVFFCTSIYNMVTEQSAKVELNGGNEIAEVTPRGEDFTIRLENAEEGKFSVSKDEMLKAVHAARLTVRARYSEEK